MGKKKTSKSGGAAKKAAAKASILSVKRPSAKITAGIKKSRKERALKAAAAVKVGNKTVEKKAVRTSIHFRRPKTLRLPRTPMYQRTAVEKSRSLNEFQVIKHPLTTESAMKKIEEENSNTIVFIVDSRANKRQIKAAVKSLYDIKAAKVNTLIRPDGQKKAYVKLTSDYDILDVANKIGIF
mmetsp:Transcript_34488/g.97284  ORF Transcript_34488/g.97284 Transcript_34488/m.97284 type:complete len:182 (-) Transcript_34488:52-597(-)|eukprot:CAMPEP_0119120600 /NCGR_PEP_ID=MMETSP1310-20130426/1567_1 /TAXON_ID=464262 /ORGANISM="Genus nov. species nov., Strain RCC2339" /LENGTH=181 /DNA_ID=CAMNT_0007110087 /DNA_START=120 /DNA_END=665 /DNA_ORIENTATION=+